MGPFEPPSVLHRTRKQTCVLEGCRAGPVEPATVAEVEALFKKGIVDGLAPGRCPRVEHLKPLSD